MSKNWIKKNKVYFDFASTIVLTIATTLALWAGYINQQKKLKLTEINYQADFRVNYGYADTLSCDKKYKEMFMVELFNDGYKVDINYTWITAFIEIYKQDSTITIPINQPGGLCSFDYESKIGKIVSYRIDNIFSRFEDVKDRTISKIKNFIPENRFIGFRLKYILKVSYMDYTKSYKESFFEITDWYSPVVMSTSVGENYFNLTKGGIPYTIEDITENFLSKKILE